LRNLDDKQVLRNAFSDAAANQSQNTINNNLLGWESVLDKRCFKENLKRTVADHSEITVNTICLQRQRFVQAISLFRDCVHIIFSHQSENILSTIKF